MLLFYLPPRRLCLWLQTAREALEVEKCLGRKQSSLEESGGCPVCWLPRTVLAPAMHARTFVVCFQRERVHLENPLTVDSVRLLPRVL